MTFKMLSKTLILLATLFLVTSTVASAQDSYSTADPGSTPEVVQADNIIESVNIAGNLIFIDDPVLFNNNCSNLGIEDFENTLAGPGSVAACPNPINNATGNACYSQGAVIPGFSMSAINPPDPALALAAVAAPAFGFTSVAAGANSFGDDTRVNFDGVVNAVGLQIIALDSTAQVDVYSGNDFLGSAVVNITSINGVFLGIAAKENITHIELVNTNGGLFYDMSFGACGGIVRAIPTLSEWGLIALAGVLGIIAVFAIRRRKAVV